MGTLRVRTWQLWGTKTADHRCFIIRTSPPRFQIVIFPRFVGNSDVFRFAKPVCKTRAGPPLAVQSTDSNADNSGQIRRKPADFSRAVASEHALATRRQREDAFVTPPPGDHRPRPVRRPPRCQACASKLSCKNKARHVRPGSSLVNCASMTRYFTEGTFPNWLSNGL